MLKDIPKKPETPAEEQDLIPERIPAAGKALASFLWTALRSVLLALLVGVTLAFSGFLALTIYNSYFRLPPEVEVPALEGKTVEEANEILQRLGLRLRVAESRHTDKPDRTIISQTPAAGRKVRVDNEVEAVVSLGPEVVEVPDLLGRSLREARVSLANNRLQLGNVSWSKRDPDKPEEVINQSPGPGEKVKPGTRVNLQLNKGTGLALTRVPDWKGQSVFQIEPELKKANLAMGGIVWTLDQVAPRGQILGQAPPPGSEVSADTPVEFEVSAGTVGTRAFKQRAIEIEVPPGSDVLKVRVAVLADGGSQTVYQGTHLAGDTMTVVVTGWPGADVEVYINEQLQSREKL